VTNIDPWLLPGAAPEADPDHTTSAGLLELLDAQAALLVAVATGGPRIDSVDARYRRRRKQLDAALRARGIAAPFPYEDLWSWHGHWSQHLDTYASRRSHIRELAAPARASLEASLAGPNLVDPGSSGGLTWSALDTRVVGIVAELAAATTPDDLQDVGRRCREVLIDAAKLLANPALVPAGVDPPKAADAKAWLDLFLAAYASGRTHRELRAFVPAAWDLAQKVTHGDIDRVDAYAAAQATLLLVRVFQQLAD
jgi:hypothetical protein